MKADFLGRVLGNWQIVRLVGEGAFGAVYEARHRAISGRRAAIKILHSGMSAHEDIRRRFLNEASAASRAEHENIVQVFDCGESEDGLCYVVMEFLRGAQLADVLHGGPLPLSRVLNIGIQVAGALWAAHRVGIVHRDLKPENILLVPRATNPEFVKVLDFGIAKLWDNDARTKTGIWMGTPPYMSPEQWQTLPDIDGRSDIYSLGIILFQCLSGGRPFSAPSPYGWLTAHLTHPVPDLRDLCPVPAALAELVQRMLAKSRDHRPRDMGEVVVHLEQSLPAERGALRLSTLPLPRGEALVSLSSSVLEELPGGGGAGPPAAASLSDESTDEAPSNPSTMRAASGETAVRPGTVRAAFWMGGCLLVLALGVLGYKHLGPVVKKKNREAAPRMAAAPSPPLPGPAPGPAGPPELPAELLALGPGSFQMGWGDAAAPDGPAHLVTVGRFAIGKYEVSQGEYRDFVMATGLSGPMPWEGVEDFRTVRDLPINLVHREQAARYCRWRYSERSGRLPSEAEWEYAARDGRSDRRFPWPGSVLGPGQANVGRRLAQATLMPVTQPPLGTSGGGLYHMIGNVAEWTADDAAPYPSGHRVPAGRGVVRGGGASTSAQDLSATTRVFVPREARDPFIGFRCAVSLP